MATARVLLSLLLLLLFHTSLYFYSILCNRAFLFIKVKSIPRTFFFSIKNIYTNYVNPFKIMIWRDLNNFKRYANFTKISQPGFGKFKERKPILRFQAEMKSAGWLIPNWLLISLDGFKITSFLHIVYSREFVNVSLLEITYIMNTHHKLEKTLKVWRAVYLNMYLANRYLKIYLIF